MRKLLWLLAGLLIIGVPAVHAQSDGGISIGLTEAPSNRADDPRARLYIVDHVAPGTTISRKVRVTNNTNTSQSIDTYAAAASIKDGQFQFGDGHARNELTTWTTVDPATASYTKGEAKLVNVTIAVPKDASEAERYAVVWASVSAPSSSGGITSVNRVGIHDLSVGPGGEPPSDFKVTGIQARRTTDGKPQIVATVENTGGRALDLSGKLRLTKGPGGLSAGPFNVELGTTLGVHQTEPVRVELNKALPAGPWHARLDLESGLVKRHAEATVTFPKQGSGPVVHPAGSSNTATFGIGALLVVLAGVVLVFFSRRRQTREPAED